MDLLKKRRILIIGLVYVMLLVVLKLARYQVPMYVLNPDISGINVVPFQTIKEYITYFNQYNPANIVKGILSLLIFLPISVIVLLLKKDLLQDSKSIFLYFGLLSTIYAVIVRVLQIGTFDIDTIILRTIVASFMLIILKALK